MSAMSQQLQSGPVCRFMDGPAATSSAFAEAGYSCDADEELQEEWETEDDVKEG